VRTGTSYPGARMGAASEDAGQRDDQYRQHELMIEVVL
jgi:hypothetical protein